jgi:hypothetical protein
MREKNAGDTAVRPKITSLNLFLRLHCEPEAVVWQKLRTAGERVTKVSKRAARIIDEVAIHLVFSGVPFLILMLFLAAQGCTSIGVHHESVLRQMGL